MSEVVLHGKIRLDSKIRFQLAHGARTGHMISFFYELAG